jgi:hypothetical protein
MRGSSISVNPIFNILPVLSVLRSSLHYTTMSAHNSHPRKELISATINKLVHALVHISDDTGEFLMTLDDGRVIDTKGWNDWEVRAI